MKNFGKCLKTLLNSCFSNQHSKEFSCSFFLKNKIKIRKFVWGDVPLSFISHASGKVSPGAAVFGANIHYFEFLSFDIILISKLMCNF